MTEIENLQLVRGSEIDDFLGCRLRWKWRWVDGLKPKRQDNKLFFGNLFHKFMEGYYGRDKNWIDGYNAMKEMFDNADVSGMPQTEIDDLWTLARDVTRGYVDKWYEADRTMRVIATEFTFAIPLANGIAYQGTIDLLYLDEHDRLWFKDYKSTSSIDRYVSRTEMDLQISRYFWALKQLADGNGYVLDGDNWIPVKEHPIWVALWDNQPHGFIYDIVARELPNKPEVLKRGGLSVAKNQKTTYKLYLQQLLDDNLATYDELPEGSILQWDIVTDDKYREMLEHLAAQETEQGNRFFRRIPVYRNDGELEVSIQEFFAAAMDAKRIREALKDEDLEYDPIYRHVTDDCNRFCPFKGMCVATKDGSDVSGLLEMFYEKEEATV